MKKLSRSLAACRIIMGLLALSILASCATTPASASPTAPAESPFFVERLVARGDYRSVILFLGGLMERDAIRRANGGDKVVEEKFLGEFTTAAELRARRSIVADPAAFKPMILELLRGERPVERSVAIDAARIVFDREYMDAVRVLLKDPNVLVRQAAVYFYRPKGDLGADWRTFGPELKAEIVDMMIGIVESSGDLVMIDAALWNIYNYALPGSGARLATLLADFDVYVLTVIDPNRGAPLDGAQRAKLRADIADLVKKFPAITP